MRLRFPRSVVALILAVTSLITWATPGFALRTVGLEESNQLSIVKERLGVPLAASPRSRAPVGLEENAPYLISRPYYAGPVVIAMKIGGTTAEVAAENDDGILKETMLFRPTVARPGADTQDQILDQWADQVSQVIRWFGPNRVMEVHVSSPGYFDEQMRLTRDQENIPGIKAGLDIAAELGKRINARFQSQRHPSLGLIEVIVVHDGTGHAKGELSRFGRHPGAPPLFFFAPGTGIAIRAIVNGKPFTGGAKVQFLANEVHTLVFNGDSANPDYRLMIEETRGDHPNFMDQTLPDGTANPLYGKQDLEDRTSGPAIAGYAQELALRAEYKDSDVHLLRDLAGGDLNKLTTAQLGQAFRQQNPIARKAILDRAKELGIGLAVQIVQFHHIWGEEFPWPPFMSGGGGVAQIGKDYLKAVKEGFRSRLQRYAAEEPALLAGSPEIEEFANRIEPSLIDESSRELLAGLPTVEQVKAHADKLKAISPTAPIPFRQFEKQGEINTPPLQVPPEGILFSWERMSQLADRFLAVFAYDPAAKGKRFVRVALSIPEASQGRMASFYTGLRVDRRSDDGGLSSLRDSAQPRVESDGVIVEVAGYEGVVVRPAGATPIYVYQSTLTFQPAGRQGASGLEEVEAAKVQAIARRVGYDRFKDWQIIYKAGSGHPGGTLSMAEIAAGLYDPDVLRINPSDRAIPPEERWLNRDRLVLSKGHAVPMQYVELMNAGILTMAEIEALRKDALGLTPGHPVLSVTPGIDFSTGALGEGAPAAVGMALAAKMDGRDYHTFAIVGDGESEKGQMDEMIRTAPMLGLDNLTVIVDYNQYQQNKARKGYTKIGFKELALSYQAAGWNVVTIIGDEVTLTGQQTVNQLDYVRQLRQALLDSKTRQNTMPIVILVQTIKGQGIPLVEDKFRAGDVSFHGKAPNAQQYEQGVREIAGKLGIVADGKTLAQLELELEQVGEQARAELRARQLTPAQIAEIDQRNAVTIEQARQRRLAKQVIPLPEYVPGGKLVATREASAAAWIHSASLQTPIPLPGGGTLDPTKIVEISPSDLQDSEGFGPFGKAHGVFSQANPYGRLVELGIVENLGIQIAAGVRAAGLGYLPIVGTFDRFVEQLVPGMNRAAQDGLGMVINASHAGSDTGSDGGSQYGVETPAMVYAISHGNRGAMFEASDAIGTLENAAQALVAAATGKVAYVRVGRNPRPILNREEAADKGSQEKQGVIVWWDPPRATKARIHWRAILVASGATVPQAIEASKLLEGMEISAKVVEVTSATQIDDATAGNPFLRVLEPGVPVYTVHDASVNALRVPVLEAVSAVQAHRSLAPALAGNLPPIFSRGITIAGSGSTENLFGHNRFLPQQIAKDTQAILNTVSAAERKDSVIPPLPAGIVPRLGAGLEEDVIPVVEQQLRDAVSRARTDNTRQIVPLPQDLPKAAIQNLRDGGIQVNSAGGVTVAVVEPDSILPSLGSVGIRPRNSADSDVKLVPNDAGLEKKSAAAKAQEALRQLGLFRQGSALYPGWSPKIADQTDTLLGQAEAALRLSPPNIAGASADLHELTSGFLLSSRIPVKVRDALSSHLANAVQALSAGMEESQEVVEAQAAVSTAAHQVVAAERAGDEPLANIARLDQIGAGNHLGRVSPVPSPTPADSDVKLVPDDSGLEEPTGFVAVGGMAVLAPAEESHLYAVTVGLEQTRAVLELSRVPPSRVVAVAVGLEEVENFKSLGIPGDQILHGWEFPSLVKAKEAAIRWAQRALEIIDGVRVQVVDATAFTVQELASRINQMLPRAWRSRTITSEDVQLVHDVSQFGV